MNQTTRSFWTDTAVMPKFPQFHGTMTVDVCIIGAGITGLTAADLLKKAGKSVAVIDLGRVGSGETSHTSAHLTEVFDLDFRDMISNFGLEGATLAAQSARRAIERIELNVHSYGLDCQFERVAGYRYTESKSQIDEIEGEAEAATKLGIPNELIFEAPLPFKSARAIRFDHQAEFHPTKYIYGLAARINGGGCHIFEDTRMIDVEEGAPCRVITDRGTINADQVFVAANVPSTNRLFLHTKIAAYRTYSIAARLADVGFQPTGLFWDLDDPYHYIRTFEQDGARYAIIGGEDHKTGQGEPTPIHFQRLEDWARERFAIERVTHHWSGQVIEPVDGLPYIGRNPLSTHVFVATGYSGTGLTMGTVGGMLVSDLILGHQNPWTELYEPSRVKPIASMKSFLAENIDYPSHMIGDRLSPAQVSTTQTLRENEGAIVRIGAKKVAAYRDSQGEMHLMSPVCPHMGCYVHWNDAEKSWDCPCHGARFDPVGKLLNGPAVQDLASEDVDENAPMIPERYDQPGALDPLGAPLLSFFTCPLHAKPT